jgi:hypothetical protein
VRGSQLRDARQTLGLEMGLGRALKMVELGRLLRLDGRDQGSSVRDWERNRTPIWGPTALAVEAMLDGWRPKDWRDAISWNKRQTG